MHIDRQMNIFKEEMKANNQIDKKIAINFQ